MFSCCLPLYRARSPNTGRNERMFCIDGHWFSAERRPLSPLRYLDPESCQRVLHGHQGVNEHLGPAFTTERQRRPKTYFVSWVMREREHSSGQSGLPPPKEYRFWRPPIRNSRPRRVLSPILDSPACAYMEQNANDNHTGPEYLEPEEAEPKAPAQEAEEASAETPEVHAEASDEESDEELEAWAPPEVLPPPSASLVAAVEQGPASEAPADKTEAPTPLDEEPSLEPALGPASEEELPPETPAGPAPELLAETAGLLPSEKLVLPPLIDLFLLFSFLFMVYFSSWGSSIVYFLTVIIRSIFGSFFLSLFFFLILCYVSPLG
uniref:Uncharacterized protein n=1 Tax=Pipistrellus kuhlii TaxID=59472 RepID=A0A7J7W332_PIPKU|nr:hypothetical protein mPipKuh1_008180 [Pipistrellus kuhlii]